MIVVVVMYDFDFEVYSCLNLINSIVRNCYKKLMMLILRFSSPVVAAVALFLFT